MAKEKSSTKSSVLRGILTGADIKLEWLLPCWWRTVRQHTTLPIAFADFGMSQSALNWCRDRGTLLDVKHSPPSHHINEEKAHSWSEAYAGDWAGARKSWLQKPFAMSTSPFEETLWLDLDCEVRDDLTPLFDFLHPPSFLAVEKEAEKYQIEGRKRGLLLEKEISYNTGVLLFSKQSPLIDAWIHATKQWHSDFLGDQNIFNRMIYLSKITPAQLPSIYNWKPSCGENKKAVIIHHVGEHGKNYLRRLAI